MLEQLDSGWRDGYRSIETEALSAKSLVGSADSTIKDIPV